MRQYPPITIAANRALRKHELLIKDVFEKIYGSGVVFVHLRGQRRVPYLSEDELSAVRDARLRKMLHYAAKTVPYYRDLFRREGIDPHDIKTVSDLDRLPFLDKSAVRKNPELFLSTSRWGREALPFTTSGSTGEPTTVYHDLRSFLANIAYGERERAVLSTVSGRVLGSRELYIIRPGSTISKVWELYRRYTFIPASRVRLLLSITEPVEHIIDMIRSYRPEIIIGYGSYLEALFRSFKCQGTHVPLPRLLVYGADCMTDRGKAMIEEHFGVPVLSIYNAVEAFKIGFFCEARKGFHLHEDLCHVRVIDADGRDVPLGEKGEVVISNLINRGTVLLNYRLGDLASLSPGPCGCGRTSPLLSELEGRVEDVLFLSSERFVHPRAVWSVLSRWSDVLRYQLIQHTPQQFELKLVTVDAQAYQRVANGILSDLRDLLGESVAIESCYSAELQAQESGKFRPVLSLCK